MSQIATVKDEKTAALASRTLPQLTMAHGPLTRLASTLGEASPVFTPPEGGSGVTHGSFSFDLDLFPVQRHDIAVDVQKGFPASFSEISSASSNVFVQALQSSCFDLGIHDLFSPRTFVGVASGLSEAASKTIHMRPKLRAVLAPDFLSYETLLAAVARDFEAEPITGSRDSLLELFETAGQQSSADESAVVGPKISPDFINEIAAKYEDDIYEDGQESGFSSELQILLSQSPRSAINAIGEWLEQKDTSAACRGEALRTLGRIVQPETLDVRRELLLRCLHSHRVSTQYAAAIALASLADSTVIVKLRGLRDDVKLELVRALIDKILVNNA